MALNPKTKELRQNRRNFRTEYSKLTEEIVKRIARGESSHDIADAIGVSLGTVVTTKGNLTRDMYVPYAYRNEDGQVTGMCQY